MVFKSLNIFFSVLKSGNLYSSLEILLISVSNVRAFLARNFGSEIYYVNFRNVLPPELWTLMNC